MRIIHLLMLGLLLPACPGEATIVRSPGGYLDSGPSWTPYTDGPSFTPAGDLVPPPPPPPGPDAEAAPAPDTWAQVPPSPDLGMPVPPGDGTPCSWQQPCASGMLCVANQCRAICTRTGSCGATAACPSSYGCVQTNLSAVCVPAAAPGQTCSVTVHCPVGYQCGSINGSGFSCMPACPTAGAACGNGGSCVSISASCAICSS